MSLLKIAAIFVMHCEAGEELRNVVCSRSILVALLVAAVRLLYIALFWSKCFQGIGILTMKLGSRNVPALKTQYTRKALVALHWGIQCLL